MYPPWWGWIFWFYLHASAESFVEETGGGELDESTRSAAQEFMKQLCIHLPCPQCSYHCLEHTTQKHPPDFRTSDDYFRYLVEFHNAVNRRNGKLEVSPEEARKLLYEKLELHQVPERSLKNAFLQVFWDMLALMMIVHAQQLEHLKKTYKNNPESVNVTPDQMVERFRTFLSYYFRLAPYHAKKLEDGETVGDFLADFVLNPTDKEFNLDSDIEGQTRNVRILFNLVCGEFGLLPRSLADIQRKINERYSFEYSSHISHAHQLRVEDHRKMTELQKELHRLQNRLMSSESSGASPAQGSTWKVVAIVMIVLYAVTFMVIAGIWYVKKKGSPFDKLVDKRGQKEPQLLPVDTV